MNKNVNIQ